MNAYLDSHLNVSLHLVSWTEKCPENKLSRVGGVAGSSGNKAISAFN